MLKHRLISGSLLIAVLLVIVFVSHWLADVLFVALAGFVIWAVLREFFAMTARIGHAGFPRLTIVGSLAYAMLYLPALQRYNGPGLAGLVAVTSLLAGFCLVFRARDLKAGLLDLTMSIAAFAYLAWPLSYMVRLYYYDSIPRHGAMLLFYVALVTKCGDIGGYTLGLLSARRAQGNHKMVPTLSPKKSWEGFVGSILFSGLAGVLLVLALGDKLDAGTVLTPVTGALIGMFLAGIGLIGDLTESVVKRVAGVKDSGGTLPGMGGVLDVIDSLIFAGPFFYCFLRLVH